MTRRLLRSLARAGTPVLAVVATIVAVRVWDAFRGPPLDPWRVFVPYDADAETIDRLDWAGWPPRGA